MDNKILVVEDDPTLRSLVANRLKAEKFTVFDAPNGQAGLQMALQEHPDLILMDIVMPQKDGLAMLRELRADDWGKDVCIIIVTNLNDDARIEEAVNHGVYDYLLKNEWSLDDLVLKIKDKLGNF